MKKFYQILQILLFVYFGSFLIFFISFDTLGVLFGMEEIDSDSMVKIILTGLIVFLLAWAIGYSVSNRMAASIEKMEREINALKAKIYDFEHPVITPNSTNLIEKEKDADPANIPPSEDIT
jgi:3-phosphoglycerate kinase